MTVITEPAVVQHLELYLQAEHVEYELRRHPEKYTAHDVAESEEMAHNEVAKVVVVSADSQTYMLLVPASRRLDLERLGPALGLGETVLQVSGETELARMFPDCEIDAIPPFGNLYGVRVYVDSMLAQQHDLVFNAGTDAQTVRMRYADFARLVHPTLIRSAPYEIH